MAADSPRRLPRPRKRFGQHFLADPRALQRIVDAVAPEPTSTVVEIGPGRGALTALLAPRAARVIAVEIDRDLAAHLRQHFAAGTVEVVEGDALEVPWASMAGSPYLLVGNLPYYITTPLLFRALEPPRPLRAVFLVQREVAERIAAPPGGREYGALTVNVQVLADAEIVGRVPAGAFHPKPNVESAIVRLLPRASPLIAPEEEVAFRAFVIGLFGFRRKQLARALRELRGITAEQAGVASARAGIEPANRAEALTPAQLVALFRALAAGERSPSRPSR